MEIQFLQCHTPPCQVSRGMDITGMTIQIGQEVFNSPYHTKCLKLRNSIIALISEAYGWHKRLVSLYHPLVLEPELPQDQHQKHPSLTQNFDQSWGRREVVPHSEVFSVSQTPLGKEDSRGIVDFASRSRESSTLGRGNTSIFVIELSRR